MKNDIYFKDEKINSFNEIVDKYGKNEFKSPYLSTIPLLVFFKSELWNNFGLIADSDKLKVKYFFEWETEVVKGKGRASCTDLMIVSDDVCIAIEAKRTEPLYASVKKWLGDSENKKLVLEGWLEIIEAKTNKAIDILLINDLPYQLIHRVASGCSMKKEETHIVYLVFDVEKYQRDYYLKSINSFLNLLGNNISIQLICLDIDKLDEQKRLELNGILKKEIYQMK
jgi:hypothetical protein